MRHELLYVGPQLDTQMYGDKMLPDIAMELMNPIATARLELERANVLLIQVNKITFETCD
jgi:hypothetical protein